MLHCKSIVVRFALPLLMLASAGNCLGCDLLLYRIKQGEMENLLLGTNHARPWIDCDPAKEVNGLVDSATRVVFESRRWRQGAGSTQNELLDALRFTSGRNLFDVLSMEEVNEIRKTLVELQLPPDSLRAFRDYRPVLVALILVSVSGRVVPEASKLPSGKIRGPSLDDVLKQSLAGKRKEVGSLESVDSIRDAFQMELAEERRLLALVMQHINSKDPRAALDDLVKDIQGSLGRGDLHTAVLKQRNVYEELGLQRLFKAMIDNRNRHMAAVIAAEAAQGSNQLFVVGALHLGGENGILCLMLRAGVEVKMKNGAALQHVCP
jgi:uncharacterized protein YbaP (TraB family)